MLTWDNEQVNSSDLPPLILASTSSYRRMLLERLQLPFSVEAPGVDETPHDHESGAELALRLARAKADGVARRHPSAVVVGSDQVADLDGRQLGKPGRRELALAQLESANGRRIVFHTAVAVVCLDTGFQRAVEVPTVVHMRELSRAEIEVYVAKEAALDCAGGAKVEGLGIALMQSVQCEDPTALIGLPLIATCALLREAGLNPLSTVW